MTYHVAQIITRMILRMLFRIRAEGVENIPRDGGVIIASNHASLIDPPGLGCMIPREISYFAKKELFRVPLVGPFIAWANGVSVDREGGGATALKEMVRRLQDGWAILVFPEGTRTRTGQFGEPKSGAGMAAVMSGVPVVPCWIEGSFRAKPFRSRITFHFLPPFRPQEIQADSKKEQYSLVSRRIMYDISKLYNSHMAVRNQAKSPEM
jgi:1-acyl-sn-glycerol-3-phosphate acyltransferase